MADKYSKTKTILFEAFEAGVYLGDDKISSECFDDVIKKEFEAYWLKRYSKCELKLIYNDKHIKANKERY